MTTADMVSNSKCKKDTVKLPHQCTHRSTHRYRRKLFMVPVMRATGGEVKKKAAILTGLIVFAMSLLTGYEIPSSEIVEIRSYHDQYMQDTAVPVFVKSGTTYETELRMVQIRIGPQRFRAYEKNRTVYEDKNSFLKVLVSVVLTDAEGNISKDFHSYLNYAECEGSGKSGYLFWDHAGEGRADKAGQAFGPEPLVVADDYIEVTISLSGVLRSSYQCSPYYDLYCESDSECLVYIDILTLRIMTGYGAAQEELQTSFEEAVTHTEVGADFSQKGEFEKAKEEYEKAQSLYDEIGDTEKSDSVQEQIDICNSYITANEKFAEGRRLSQEAAGIEDYTEAIEKYEEALSNFETAQEEYDEVDNTAQSDECQIWIDLCNDEIENLENVGKLRTRLLLVIVVIAIGAGVSIVVNLRRKEKPPRGRGITLEVRNAETGESVSIEVSRFDKIGKVRQVAGTKLGVIPFELVFNGEVCPPDSTVEECGLQDGGVVEVVLTKERIEEEKKVERKIEPEKVPGEEPKIVYGDNVFFITKDVTTIGRGENADIQVEDPERVVSRIHAKIYREKEQYWIEDNNSANGTFMVRDDVYTKIQKERLKDKDVIVLSYKPEEEKEVKMTFEITAPEEMYRKTRVVHPGAVIAVDGKEFKLTKDVTTIGRGENADIQVEDPERVVSRIHAKIYREKEQYWIEDNNSANGTFMVRDDVYTKIQKERLKDKDVIVLSYNASRDTQVTLQVKISFTADS